ncbi:MAG: cation:proton antiporter [Haloferacaceae archaeon]
MSSAVLAITALVLTLGVTGQVLSEKLQIPSVLFHIISGVLIGPQGLGLVTQETFGDGLFVIVGVGVAVIVFEGAFELRRERLQQAPKAITAMVSIGALIMFLGTAAVVHYVIGPGWEVSLLIGALLIATGPTVITPILEVVTVREQVSAVLEAEGIINDVTAAILAVVIFELLVIGDGTYGGVVLVFVGHIGVGVVSGLVVSAVVYYALVHLDLTPKSAPHITRLVVFAGIVTTYAAADAAVPETGIAAAATAGIVLGNLDVPHREAIETFERDARAIVLSFIFIVLASLLDFADIAQLGIAGVIVVVLVTLVVRPLLVFLSVRSWRFTRDEKFFLSLVGPRGIIPASVTTVFAIQLQQAGQTDAAQALVGVVFLIIFVTVVLQAGLSRQIADILNVIPMRTIIAGGGRVGRTLARQLEQRGQNVVLIDSNQDTVRELRELGFTAYEGDATEANVLRNAEIEDAKIVVAATGDDNENLLISQLARSKFDVEGVYARVNRPENVDAFDTLDVTAIDASLATAWSIDNEIERPAMAHWMNELGEGHEVVEIEVTAEDLAGKTIREVNEEIPAGCIVAVIGRGDDAHVPDADDAIEYGDHVTFLGDQEAVRKAARRFHPHS